MALPLGWRQCSSRTALTLSPLQACTYIHVGQLMLHLPINKYESKAEFLFYHWPVTSLSEEMPANSMPWEECEVSFLATSQQITAEFLETSLVPAVQQI